MPSALSLPPPLNLFLGFAPVDFPISFLHILNVLMTVLCNSDGSAHCFPLKGGSAVCSRMQALTIHGILVVLASAWRKQTRFRSTILTFGGKHGGYVSCPARAGLSHDMCCVVVWLCSCVVVWLCGCVVAWLCTFTLIPL